MIVALSTSSTQSSVALIDNVAGVMWHASEHSPRGASGACLRMLEQMALDTSVSVADADVFAVDIGPGSFTGVRVGVTLAKMFGFLFGKPVTGATSFDLVSAAQTVVLPSKKGEFFVREPSCKPYRTLDLPEGEFVGFGPGFEPQTFPDAARFEALRGRLVLSDPIEFVPEYLIDPSISTPKKPFQRRRGADA